MFTQSKFGFRFNAPSPDSPLGKAVAASPQRAEAKGDGSMGGMGAGLSMLSLAGVEKGKSGGGSDYDDSECKEDEAKVGFWRYLITKRVHSIATSPMFGLLDFLTA